ncbi:MAG TPA: trigger factor [Candidatus Angelobacter sp.]
MSSIEPEKNDATPDQTQSAAVSNPEAVSGNPAEPAEEEEVVDINLGCLRQVEVEIPAEVVSKELDSMVQRYTKVARVPGFRKGKVPASLVRNRFAEEIKADMLEALLPEYFRQAVIKEGFAPISKPEVHSLEAEEGKPIRFKAAFEILPDIELGNYQDIKVVVPEIKVTDEDVEAELKKLQERQSSYDPVDEDRPLQDGDFAQISFQALAKDEAAETVADESAAGQSPAEGEAKPKTTQPVQMDEVLVEIAGPDTIPAFSENLRGAKAGEERTFDVTYPAEYYESRLAGKTFSYTAKVNAVKKKTTPELSDDFAKELNQEIQSLEDLKKRLHEGIQSDREHKSLHEAREHLLNQLTEIHQFPVPETLIRRQIDFRLEQWLRSLAAQGMRTEDMKRMDFKRLRASQREAATREVKANLLLEKIAEAEHLQASDDEVQQEIHSLAQQTKQTPEAVQQKLAQEGALDRIRSRIRADKALRFLYTRSTANAQNGTVQE